MFAQEFNFVVIDYWLFVFTDDYYAVVAYVSSGLFIVGNFLTFGVVGNFGRVGVIGKINGDIFWFLVSKDIGFGLYVVIYGRVPIQVFWSYHQANSETRAIRSGFELEVGQLPHHPIFRFNIRQQIEDGGSNIAANMN